MHLNIAAGQSRVLDARAAASLGPVLKTVIEKLGPHGGARCIPVPEYLQAIESGSVETQQRFFAGLQMRNGVYKTTYPNRMNDLFPTLLTIARDLRPLPLRVLDVACSSGVSTSEMHRAFTSAGIPCEAYGTDLMISADYVRRDDGVGMLFDHDAQLIQVDIGGWASPWRWGPRDLVLRPWLSLRARKLASRDLDSFRAVLTREVPGFRTMKVSMLSSLARNLEGVHFCEENILEPRVPGPFAVIRAANILNLVYFPPDEIRRMARALCERLMEGGILTVTRTSKSNRPNRGTLFRWRSGRLEPEVRTNGGSEVEGIIAC